MKVHWSIKLNLIDAFGGESSVFVRVSVDDNMNVKTGMALMALNSEYFIT
jgi:hypothetical protein